MDVAPTMRALVVAMLEAHMGSKLVPGWKFIEVQRRDFRLPPRTRAQLTPHTPLRYEGLAQECKTSSPLLGPLAMVLLRLLNVATRPGGVAIIELAPISAGAQVATLVLTKLLGFATKLLTRRRHAMCSTVLT